MTYEIVDLDGGDVLAAYAKSEDALRAAREMAQIHPELVPDLAVLTIDELGLRVGAPILVGDFAPADAGGVGAD